MRKIILSLLFLWLPAVTYASNWTMKCTNNSCVAEQGALKVYWVSIGLGKEDIYQGKLTGVQGIPISIENYQAVEKQIEAAIEKAITRKKSSDATVKDEPPTGGVGAGTTGSKEKLFTKKRSITQSKLMGKKVNIDYTLAMVKWWGDTGYRYVRNIQRYWASAEDILDRYGNGTIGDLIELFLVGRNAEEVDSVAIDTPLNEENRNIILTKYIGLTRYPAIDVERRYATAAEYVCQLATNPYTGDAERVSKEYREDMEALAMLTKPNQTALKLHREGKKDLSYAKWLADNNKFTDTINQMQIQDRYVVALRIVREFLKGNGTLPKRDKFFLSAEKEKFTKAIERQDETVKTITFKGPLLPIPAIFLLVAILLSAGAMGIYMARKTRKKKVKPDENKDKTKQT